MLKSIKHITLKLFCIIMTYCHIIGKQQMNTMFNYDNSCMKTIILYPQLTRCKSRLVKR